MLHATDPASARGTDEFRELWAEIASIPVAMVTTRDGDVLRSRPMVASVDRGEGAVYFFVNRSDPKVAEIAAVPDVALSFVDSRRQLYLSVSGVADIVVDPDKAAQHAQPATLAWFEEGITDPQLRLMRVRVIQAEKWAVDTDPAHKRREIARSLGTPHTPDVTTNEKFGPAVRRRSRR